MTKITQAFIFAAGRGSRMRPLTDTIPKPLVKINGKAIIDYIIEKLDKIESIQKIFINGFYLADQLEEHVKNLNNPKVIFSREFEKIETGGALAFAKDKINLNEPILTVNGDVLWQEKEGESDIQNICESWNENDCEILLGLKKTEEYLGYDKDVDGGGDFILENGDIFKFPDKKMSHVFVGLQIINPKILENSPSENCFSMSHFYKAALQEGGLLNRIKAVELKGKYFHIGTVDAIKMTEKNI